MWGDLKEWIEEQYEFGFSISAEMVLDKMAELEEVYE